MEINMTRTVVIVTPCPSHPTIAGNRTRIYEIGKKLREHGFRIVFIHYVLEQVDALAHTMMKAYWDDYHVVQVPDNQRNIEQIELDGFVSLELRSLVAQICKTTKPYLVIVNYVWMAGALDAAP